MESLECFLDINGFFVNLDYFCKFGCVLWDVFYVDNLSLEEEISF